MFQNKSLWDLPSFLLLSPEKTDSIWFGNQTSWLVVSLGSKTWLHSEADVKKLAVHISKVRISEKSVLPRELLPFRVSFLLLFHGCSPAMKWMIAPFRDLSIYFGGCWALADGHWRPVSPPPPFREDFHITTGNIFILLSCKWIYLLCALWTLIHFKKILPTNPFHNEKFHSWHERTDFLEQMIF